ncbi:unnamed protein product [Ascophyllum nodosum]
MGCGDASCSNCDPHAFSRVLESFPDHAESVDFRSLQPPFVKPGPPLAFATPESTSSFMHHMTEESGCESGQCRHRELAKAAASAVFKEVFGERKAQHQEDGAFAEESKEGNRNPEGLSISVSDSEEGREREGDVVGAGGNESDDSEGSNAPSPSEDYDDEEEECDDEESPPALTSDSDIGYQPVSQALRPDLYEAYRRARARQKDEKDTGKLDMLAYNFWEEKGDSINPVFANFFEKQVLKGRPVPHADTCLLTKNLPRGFPEFVAFVGAANVDVGRREISREDLPTGFLAYAREAVVQQARARLNGVEARPSPRRKGEIEKKAERETGQQSKGSGQTKGTVQSSRDKLESSTSNSRNTLKSSEMKPKRGGKGRSGDCDGAAVANALRRDFKAAAMRRQDMNKIADNLEKKALSSLKKLSMAFEREKALHKKELAAERAALVAAREELKAFVGDGSRGVRILPVREALDKAEALKKRANAVLADTRYPEAVGQYTLGIKVLEPHVKPARNGKQARYEEEHRDSSGEENAAGGGGRSDRCQEEDGGADSVAAKEMLLILLCNRSLAHLKWGNLGSAKADAQQAMDIDPRHIKAYFRRAAAHKQAERYREALTDLRYMLRLEPPPVKGAPVSDDILAVQKMARECERKVRETGFKKALEETTNAKLAASALSKKEAREKWDVARRTKGAKKKHKRLPAPPRKAGKSAPVWEHTGESFLLPFSGVPTLKELSASVAAECIDRAPDAYVHWCEGLLSEYLVLVFERLSWVSLQTMMSSGLYDELGIVSSNAQADNWQAQDKQYRRIYAAVDHDAFLCAASEVAASGVIGGVSAAVAGKGVGGKKSNPPPLLPWKVLDPHLGLMDVLENHALFTHQAWDAEEEATPKLFDFNTGHPAGRAVVNREEFFQQFNVFTEGQLTFMDWNNVIAAGGSVLASTHPPPPGPLRDFYHTQAYRASDVDLFLYGLDDKAATQKVRQIYASIKLANSKIFAVRTLRAITFVSEFPYRKVQIVLRLYKTLAEVLHGFDVDACSIGFDGHTVWCTNRAARAMCKRYNVVDLSRRSPSYENRLFKYSKRGHAVFVRGMKVDKVAPSLTQGSSIRNPHSEQGLAKLICLDRRHRRYNMAQFNSFFERWNLGLAASPEAHLQETREIHRQEHTPDSDYTHVFIPYGPKWTRDRTLAHVHDYIRAANTLYYRLNLCQNPQAQIQPVVYGTIDHVLEIGVNTGEEEKMVYSHEDDMLVMRMKHVNGDKMWLKVNPGNQGIFGVKLTRSGDHVPLLTGSFHPTPCTKEQWERGAYVKGRRSPRGRSAVI